MKIGVDAPWYDDPVERMAFNLYAMECQNLDDIAENISNYDPRSRNWDAIQQEYELSDGELEYVRKRVEGEW